MDAEGSRIQNQPGLHYEFETNLDYIKLYLQTLKMQREGRESNCFRATTSQVSGSLLGFILVLLQVDVKKTALALAITDSELSDEEASILESGGFSVSRATTPQLTDVSEGMSSLLPS